MENRIYCGSGKEKFEGNLVEISVCLSDLPKDKIFEYNNKKYIKLKVVKKREVDQYGKTHYVEVDMFEPEQKTANEVIHETNYDQDKHRQEFKANDVPPTGEDDLPF